MLPVFVSCIVTGVAAAYFALAISSHGNRKLEQRRVQVQESRFLHDIQKSDGLNP